MIGTNRSTGLDWSKLAWLIVGSNCPSMARRLSKQKRKGTYGRLDHVPHTVGSFEFMGCQRPYCSQFPFGGPGRSDHGACRPVGLTSSHVLTATMPPSQQHHPPPVRWQRRPGLIPSRLFLPVFLAVLGWLLSCAPLVLVQLDRRSHFPFSDFVMRRRLVSLFCPATLFSGI